MSESYERLSERIRKEKRIAEECAKHIESVNKLFTYNGFTIRDNVYGEPRLMFDYTSGVNISKEDAKDLAKWILAMFPEGEDVP